MADPEIASVPQAFTFGNRNLKGRLTKFTGSSKRRSVDHESPKRDAAKVEDMGRRQMRLAVQLVFTGPNCAREYQEFKSYVSDHPSELLVHPIAGRWKAYTEGPDEDVDFSRAFDEIQVRCEFKEDQFDALVERDAPDPATAAQNASAQLTSLQKVTAAFMGAMAKAETFVGQSLATLDSALGQLDTLTDPVDFMRDTIGSVVGAGSSAIGKATAIATKSQLLVQDVENYIASAGDLFEGSDAPAGGSTTTATQLGTVEASALALEDELIASSPTPAGAADAVGEVEETLAACWVLDAALRAARPPTITYVVTELMDVITVAMRTGLASTALARASSILALNRIPNPAAIPAGTSLLVPTR